MADSPTPTAAAAAANSGSGGGAGDSLASPAASPPAPLSLASPKPQSQLAVLLGMEPPVAKKGATPSELVCLKCNATVQLGGGSAQNFVSHYCRVHGDAIPPPLAPLAIAYYRGQLAKGCRSPSPAPESGKKRTIADALQQRMPSPAEVTRALAAIAVVDCRPFSFVEGLGFRDFFRKMLPGVPLPGRRTLARYASEERGRMTAKLLEQLKSALAVSLTCDYWSSPDGKGFLGVTGTWIHRADLSMRTDTLLMDYQPTAHTTAALVASLSEVIDLLPAKTIVGAITTDNGTNMINAAAALTERGMELFGIRCFGHLLNLAWGDITRTDPAPEDEALREVSQAVCDVRTIVMAYCNSPARVRVLANACAAAGLAARAPVFPVATRWWSELAMLRRFRQLEPAFMTVSAADLKLPTARADLYEDARRRLTHTGLVVVEWLVGVCSVWERWQAVLSAGNRATASLYCDAIEHILLTVNRTAVEELRKTPRLYLLAPACERVAVVLRKRMVTNPDLQHNLVVFRAARMLDPRTYTAWIQRFGVRHRVATLASVVRLMGVVRDSLARAPPPTTGGGLDDPFAIAGDPMAATATQAKADDEAARAFVRGSLAAAAAAGKDWREFYAPLINDDPTSNTNIIARVACRLLCVLPESTASERVFSLAGRVVRGRNRLAPKTLSDLVLLNSALRSDLVAGGEGGTTKRFRSSTPAPHGGAGAPTGSAAAPPPDDDYIEVVERAPPATPAPLAVHPSDTTTTDFIEAPPTEPGAEALAAITRQVEDILEAFANEQSTMLHDLQLREVPAAATAAAGTTLQWVTDGADLEAADSDDADPDADASDHAPASGLPSPASATRGAAAAAAPLPSPGT